MRGDFHDTKLLLDMAAKMLVPLESDTEGQRGQPKAVIDGFKEQRRLYHFHRGSRALHTNEPKESISEFEKFWVMLRDEVIEGPLGSERCVGLAWDDTFRAMLQEHSRRDPRGQDQYLGVAWNELGNAYLQNEDTEKAEACYRKSFTIMNVADGEVTPNTVSMPLINLGFALWLRGWLSEAAAIFEDALKYREKAYGSDDIVSFAYEKSPQCRQMVANSISSLGKLYLGYGNVKKDQGDLDASFELHRRCLTQYLTSLGKYHHRIGDGSVRLSDHYVRTGKLVEAKYVVTFFVWGVKAELTSSRKLLDRAYDIYGGHAHFRPEQARTMYKRSEVLRLMQRSEEADREAQQAFRLFRLVVPNDRRSLDQLTVRDFDRPIMFWSK